MGEGTQATRSTSGSDTRNAVDSHAFTVWLQEERPLSDDSATRDLLREGVKNRLQELFDLVADESGPPRKIKVRWTADVSAESVKDNEIVIYFMKKYSQGLIKSYLEGRADERSMLPDQERENYQALADGVSTIQDGGLTLTEDSWGPWSLSEVYAEVCIDESAAQDAANSDEVVRDWQGGNIGNLAFHEAMHNQIDPTKRDSWDLHSSGGDGLAVANVGEGTEHTNANIEKMAAAINKDRKQYIKGKTKPPAPAKKEEEKKEVDSDYANLSSGL